MCSQCSHVAALLCGLSCHFVLPSVLESAPCVRRENVCAAALDEVSSVCLLDLSVVKCGSGPVSPCWSSVWMISVAGSGAVKSCQCSAVQSLSRVRLFAAPRTVVRQASLCVTNSQSSLKLASIMLVIPSNHLILCRPLLLLPSIFPSIRVFSNVSSLHQVAKVLELQLQHESFQ